MAHSFHALFAAVAQLPGLIKLVRLNSAHPTGERLQHGSRPQGVHSAK